MKFIGNEKDSDHSFQIANCSQILKGLYDKDLRVIAGARIVFVILQKVLTQNT